MENYLTIPTQDGDMCAYAAAPEESSSPSSVVIVFQEAFGVNEHIKGICTRLAQEGYFAIAPELFHRQGKHLHFDYTDKSGFLHQLSLLTNQTLLEDVRATIDFLPQLPNLDSNKIFTLGFCMGGFTSLLASTQFYLRGAVSFYGAGVVHERDGIGYKPFLKDLSGSKCPLLMFFGEEDVSIPEADRYAMRATLDAAHVPHEMNIITGADHGFFCDERKVYQPEAAERAWKKTLEWMQKLNVEL